MITDVSASVRIAFRLVTAVAIGGLAVTATLGATPGDVATATPIKHVVVVFQENVPFDRYFGAYPYALNPPGEPRFVARPGTPSLNGLTETLRNHNPNSANPHRLSRDTPNGTADNPNGCGSNHGYTAMQLAEDNGLVDLFVEYTGNHSPGCDPAKGMGYFDGNTVTALWEYAQHFALNDNSFTTTFGPSHIGAVNLITGQTHGAVPEQPGILNGTLMGNVEPTFDDCPVSDPRCK